MLRFSPAGGCGLWAPLDGSAVQPVYRVTLSHFPCYFSFTLNRRFSPAAESL